MPIYEYYCPDNHTIYQFYAKTLAQGRTTPKCPDNPKYKMKRLVSAFAITGRGAKEEGAGKPDDSGSDAAGDARMESAMAAMEKEFSSVDENDPRAMGRMMRKMADLTGEKMGGEMEEVVRKLEEGTDPDALEEKMGGQLPGDEGADEDGMGMGPGQPKDLKEPRHRFRVRRTMPRRDPQLYDYE